MGWGFFIMTWTKTNSTNNNWSKSTIDAVSWTISSGTSTNYQGLTPQVTGLVDNITWSGALFTWDGVGLTSYDNSTWNSLQLSSKWSSNTKSKTLPNWS